MSNFDLVLLHQKRLKQAGKAFNRLQGDFHSEAAEFEACDRSYDAGEWSGPAWGKIYEETEQRHANLVARAFGITPDEVWYAAQDLEHGEEQRRWEAQTPWEPYTDNAGVRQHGRVCAEHHERGLNCSCIPVEEQQRISRALARGDAPEDVIDSGWGQYS